MKFWRICAFSAIGLSILVFALHSVLSDGGLPPAISLGIFGAACITLSFVKVPTASRFAASFRFSSQRRSIVTPIDRAEELRAAAASRAERITNAFTIDLEDYFHTEVATQAVPYSEWDSMPARLPATAPRMLDMLERHNVKATVFVLGYVARRHPLLVKEIAQRGHEVACHSDLHRPVFRLTPDEFREDTRTAKSRIEDLVGFRVSGYRAPSFSITPGTEWAFDVLSELEFEYDSSVNPVKHRFYGNPNAPRFPYMTGKKGLLEIPVATRRVAGKNMPVSGGAYLRLLPYSYVEAGLEYINQHEGKPFTMYVHPWEIDSHQVPMNLTWSSQIRQNSGTDEMEAKLESLLTKFDFAPMAKVYSELIRPSRATVLHPALQAA